MFVNKDECAIKLGDFGLARYSLGNPLRTYCGTTEYMVKTFFSMNVKKNSIIFMFIIFDIKKNELIRHLKY